MAEIATLSLNDRNPTARSFVPSSKDGLLVSWRYAVGSVPALYPTVTLSTRALKAGVNRKCTIKVTVPEEVTIDGVAVIKSAFMSADFVVPEEVATTTTQDLLAYVADLLANSIVTDAIENGNAPY
jgi:hypothetical protein